ncbi:MAG: family 43 glycosylhydrolase, partial [Luteolibacter sp.]
MKTQHWKLRNRMWTWLLVLSVFAAKASLAVAEPGVFRPGVPWPDTAGVHINAHGNNIIEHNGRYYWYGSHKIAGKTESEKNEAGISCYVSDDLLTWTQSGLVLSVTSEGQHPEIADAGILDRPKVIFNPATEKFVMYF